MAGLQLFGHCACPLWRDAREFLSQRGIAVKPHELANDPPSYSVILSALQQAGPADLLDVEVVRGAGIDSATADTTQLAQWVARHPTALRMPLIVRGSQVVAGIDHGRLEALIY